jgi:hypothetical protein
MSYYNKYLKYKTFYLNYKKPYVGGSSNRSFLSDKIPKHIGNKIIGFLPETDISINKKAPRKKRGNREYCDKLGHKPYELGCIHPKSYFDDGNQTLCCDDTIFDIANSDRTSNRLNYDKFFDCVSKLVNNKSPQYETYLEKLNITEIFNLYFPKQNIPNYLNQSDGRNGRQVLVTEKVRGGDGNNIEFNEMIQAFTMSSSISYGNVYEPDESYQTSIPGIFRNKTILDILSNQDCDIMYHLQTDELTFNLGILLFHFCRLIFNLYNPIVDEGIEPTFTPLSYRGSLVRSQWNKEIWSLFWTSYLIWLFDDNKYKDNIMDIIESKDYDDLKEIIDLFYDEIRNEEIPSFQMIYDRLMKFSNIETMAQLYFNKPY